METIVASYNVTPNEPTPNDPLWLSGSDQIGFLGHVPTIYIYKAKHNTNTIEKMRNSLGEILVYYYPVAGRLNLKESGRMEVDCNAKGVTLIEAETTNTLNDYGDFSPSESTEELVPKIDYTQPIEELPLLLVQLTRFHGGEGFAIGVAISHPLVDGISAIHFINAWAKLARGETLDPNEMPFLDRTILKNMVEKNDNIFRATNLSPAAPVDHPEWKPAPLIPDKNAEKNKKIRVAVLKLTSKQVEKLKKKANDQHQPLKEGSRPYSRFEAIAAHTWRCASKAREFGDNQPTLVRFIVDIRNRVIPPLPRNYFGNALAKTVTPKCCVGEIISKPLGYVAQKIRDAIHAVTDEYIRSQLSVILGQEQLDCIRAFFLGQGSHMSLPHPGNHNIHFTSWITMPVYDADFGWGKPMHFGLGSEYLEERAVIIPSSDGDGVVLSMSFQTAQMQLFNKFFYEDI